MSNPTAPSGQSNRSALTLEGKVAVIAGASSGINLAIARRFAATGARVAILSRSPERIETAADSIRATGADCLGFAADVRDPEAVQRAYARIADAWGSFDVLVSGAAGNFLAPVVDLSPNAFKTVVDIDLNGTFNVLSLAWPHLTTPGASLLSITAPQAVRPTVMQAHACAAKAGVNMLTKVLAMEWGPAGVRVNAISPGFIAETEGTARLIDTDAKREALLKSVPLRRLGSTDDISDLALYLAHESSSFVTGAILNCDGGYVLGASESDALTLESPVGT